jgi:hypothetical protein
MADRLKPVVLSIFASSSCIAVIVRRRFERRW